MFDKIVHLIQHQDRHVTGECSCQDVSPLRLFITGVGGTGKSFLIDALHDYIVHDVAAKSGEEMDYGSVVVLAPTGVAAFNVNGQTIHRCFKLPVQKGRAKNPRYISLDKPSLKEIRNILKHSKLIIIDEISMVSNGTLAMIHRRLEEVFGGAQEGKSFGDKNILVLGDLLQLKPVKSPFCFEQLTVRQVETVLGGINLGYKLWDEFKYDELTENMRQKDDTCGFIDMLLRLRVGSPTDDDIKKLQDRLIEVEGKSQKARMKSSVQYFYDNLKNKNALCVLATNESVKEFNDQMLKICNIETVDIQCEEPINMTGAKKRKLIKKSSKKEKVSETAGLETVLTLGVGARVMLRRNIDVTGGLVNGAMGAITKINVSYAI